MARNAGLQGFANSRELYTEAMPLMVPSLLLELVSTGVATAGQVAACRVGLTISDSDTVVHLDVCRDGAFTKAWSETVALKTDGPIATAGSRVATIDVWLVSNQPPCDGGGGCRVPREPDWTLEYHRIGDAGYLKYAEPGVATGQAHERWTRTSPSMEKYLSSRLGHVTEPSGPRAAWGATAAAAVSLAGGLIVIRALGRLMRRKAGDPA